MRQLKFQQDLAWGSCGKPFYCQASDEKERGGEGNTSSKLLIIIFDDQGVCRKGREVTTAASPTPLPIRKNCAFCFPLWDGIFHQSISLLHPNQTTLSLQSQCSEWHLTSWTSQPVDLLPQTWWWRSPSNFIQDKMIKSNKTCRLPRRRRRKRYHWERAWLLDFIFLSYTFKMLTLSPMKENTTR